MALARDSGSTTLPFTPFSTPNLYPDHPGSAQTEHPLALDRNHYKNNPSPELALLQPYEPKQPPPSSLVSTPTHRQHSPRRSLSSTTSSATLVASTQPSPALRADAKFMADNQRDPEKHASDTFYSSFKASQRPLIDLATSDWKHADYDDSDDEYYRRDSDEEMPPPWKRIVAAPASRLSHVPRRVQRYFVIYATLLIAAWVSWKWIFQPDWESNRAIEKSLNEDKVFFGSNMRPEFSDMIQIKSMDTRLLPSDENFKQRLVIVGDVHGCKDELQALLDKVKFRAPHDHLTLTGDMISKGPDSAGVVSLARSLSASCVRGNHEDRMLLALADMRGHHAALPGPAEDPTDAQDLLDEESFSHGDYTFRSLAREFDDKQIKWLQACPVILRVGEIAGLGEMVVVHAGLVPGIPLERQDPYHVMNMRTIDLDTRLPSENREGTPWEKLWNKYQSHVPPQSAERSSVVYGHDSKRGKNIHKYSFGLDSGCVAGGRLTALVIEAGRKGEVAKTRTVDVKCKTYWQKSQSKTNNKSET